MDFEKQFIGSYYFLVFFIQMANKLGVGIVKVSSIFVILIRLPMTDSLLLKLVLLCV
jgi:hypothetical protein